jgi:hypothetical protein
MAIHSRIELLSRFVNGAIPSQADYRDLIDSMLNRRDDRFFGIWRQGMKYCKGDVVIYGKALYLLFNPNTEEECPPNVEDDENGNGNGNGNGKNGKSEGCICSVIPPDEDDQRWCPLELEVDDRDWGKIEVDGEVVTVYNLNARIGIGTDQPQARLEITDGVNSLQFEPSNTSNPRFSLLRLPGSPTRPAERVDFRLKQRAEWTTNALGYAFFRELPEANAAQSSKTASKPVEPPVLLFITSEREDQARVGIGTDQPKGVLDALQPGRGEMILNPGAAREPALLLVNLEPAGNGAYLIAGVTQDTAYLQTGANDGFRFRKGGDLSACLKNNNLDTGESLMTIKGNGKVGIGTEDPRSKLEVQARESGAIRLDVSRDNPAVSVINSRPTGTTYHAIGVDDDTATFVTNAPRGFLFKSGGPCGAYDNEVNINQGDKTVFIGDTGKVGIQTLETPKDYDLEVNGQVKALASYLETDGSNIEQTGDLSKENVLGKLEKLNPIKFKWKKKVNADRETHRYGFFAQNVFEHFPGLVKNSDGVKSVAYANMTAILVQAIKEQQEIIRKLDQRICDLEERLGSSESA